MCDGHTVGVRAGQETSDLREAVTLAAVRLAGAGVASARVDAEVLAAHLLGVEPSEVRRRVVVGGYPAPAGYGELVATRARRIPLQHLTGYAPFRRLRLAVGPGVFVPRPETEVVVEHALAALDAAGTTPVAVDLGTGSGAIALSIKSERPAARVYAVERERRAVAWARRNRDELDLDVAIVHDDAAQALPDLCAAVDVVACNPPYIPPGAVPVDPEVRDHDPPAALYGGGPDGLQIPAAMATRAAALLRPGGSLVMEHADVQGEQLMGVIAAIAGFVDIHDHRDLAGRSRVVVAVRQ